jgi:hypothetical protein
MTSSDTCPRVGPKRFETTGAAQRIGHRCLSQQDPYRQAVSRRQKVSSEPLPIKAQLRQHPLRLPFQVKKVDQRNQSVMRRSQILFEPVSSQTN